MMVLWMVSWALAAQPEGLDLTDPQAFEEAAKVFDAGPEGCWTFTGKLTLRVFRDSGASMLGRAKRSDETVQGTFDATFVDHTWTRFHYTVEREKEPWMVVRPGLGEVADGAVVAVDADGEPVDPPLTEAQKARMKRFRERLGFGDEDNPANALQMASYAFAEWRDDPGEVVLIEEGEFTGIGRGRGRSVHRFPGGELVATSRDLELPTGATIGRWPLQGSVKEAVIAMRGHRVGDEVLPLAQRVSAIASIYGQTLGIDSLLRFTTARRCSAGAETAEGGPLAQEGEVPPPEATQAPR